MPVGETGTINFLTCGTNNGAGNGTATTAVQLVFWGPQVEFGVSSPGGYVPTKGTGAQTIYSLGAMTLGAPTTNLAVGSTDLSNTTNWPDFTSGNNNRSTGFIAPDGTSTAVKIMPTSANSPGHHVVEQTITASGSTTFSIFAKAAEYNFLVISGYSYNYVSINLTTGVITDGSSGLSGFTAINVGNGWWRISATGSGNWGGQFQFGAAPDATNATFTGNGTSGIYVWGPQFETGTVATGYVPTTTTSATGPTPPWINSNIQSVLIS